MKPQIRNCYLVRRVVNIDKQYTMYVYNIYIYTYIYIYLYIYISVCVSYRYARALAPPWVMSNMG